MRPSESKAGGKNPSIANFFLLIFSVDLELAANLVKKLKKKHAGKSTGLFRKNTNLMISHGYLKLVEKMGKSKFCWSFLFDSHVLKV